MSASVKGIGPFLANLRRVGVRARSITKRIGFNVDYAAAVHEVLDAHHDQGQAKFLESSLRRNAPRFGPFVARRVAQAISRGQSAEAAAVQAVNEFAEHVIGDAQQIAPVLTGALKGGGTVGATAREVAAQEPVKVTR